MDLPSQIPYSKDQETKGFDMLTGNTWIYPENYPVREYQYNIVKTALYYNTLVCLPTGKKKNIYHCVIISSIKLNILNLFFLTYFRFRKNLYCCCRNVQFLEMVSIWKNCIPCTHKTFGCSTD